MGDRRQMRGKVSISMKRRPRARVCYNGRRGSVGHRAQGTIPISRIRDGIGQHPQTCRALGKRQGWRACRPGGRACQNPAVSDLNYLADCLRRFLSYHFYSQSTFVTGVPDRTSAPASGSALPRISTLTRRQYQLLRCESASSGAARTRLRP
jgi:hypothetical protein